MKIRGALRVYPGAEPHLCHVAADHAGDRGGCYHLEQPDPSKPRLIWVKHPEGDKMRAIDTGALAIWLVGGGLGISAIGDDAVVEIEGGDT